MPQVASMGAAVSIVDFDRDGWPDIYVTNSAEGSRNALYRNLHDGTFKDVAEEVGIARREPAGHRRVDGRGLGRLRQRRLRGSACSTSGDARNCFTTMAGKRFHARHRKRRAAAWVNANTAIWLDYDGDGLLDLFVGGYYSEDVDLWHLQNTQMMPESFEYAKNGGRKYLFHNLGDGKFEEVSEKMGINSRRWAWPPSAADLRGTGYPDLFVANDYGVSELYLQRWRNTFAKSANAPAWASRPRAG